ncbi:unnamed protein product [Lactuca virosa]|uniref:Uncharacterized protein n=1 Tax=Lactuca virosa TaxID=75947 RepID=A0AAU9P7Q5_9ASTR|nr:unnamed protein product [Lactuca virosa]
MTGMGDDMSTVASKVDCYMLERYTHEYYLSPVLSFLVPSSTSSVLYAPPGKIGFYLRHLLISYFVGDIPPKSIVVDDVVPDRDVDQMTSTLESPITFPGFGPNSFSIDKLLDISCPVIGSVQVDSSTSVGVVPPGSVSSSGCPYCVLYEEDLEEACWFIARAEKIISATLRRDLKFFDGLLTLQDWFLDAEMNLRVAEGMKLASKEMLVKAGEMYVDLSIRHWDAMAKVASLENQGTLVQAKYEACL